MKLLVSLLLTSAVFSFGSCKKEQTANPKQAIYKGFTIRPTDWIKTADNLGYYTSLPVPELTESIRKYGSVSVYLSFDIDKDNPDNSYSQYDALPEVFDGIIYGTYHEDNFVNIDFYKISGDPVELPSGNIKAKI